MYSNYSVHSLSTAVIYPYCSTYVNTAILTENNYLHFLGACDTGIGEIFMLPEAWKTSYVIQLLNEIRDEINGEHRGLHFRRIPWTQNSYHG